MTTHVPMNESSFNRELIAIIEPGGEYVLDWRTMNESSDAAGMECQQNLHQTYLDDPERAWFLLGTSPKTTELSESLEYLRKVASTFVRSLARYPDLETLRGKAQAVLDDEERHELLSGAPYLIGGENLNESWLELAWDRLNKAFSKEMAEYQGSVTGYFLSRNPDLSFAGRVYFHLVENKGSEYPFAFLATYTAEPAAAGKAKHLPLKNALVEYGENSEKLLELLMTVNRASRQSSFVAELMESGEIFYPIGLEPGEAYTFLKEIPLYEQAGILCRIPNWWKKKSNSPKVTMSVGAKAPAHVGMEALLDFDLQLSLGGETVTVEEIKELISESEGLAFIKGKWVEVDHERLRETLAAYEQAYSLATKGGLTMMEAIRMRLFASKAHNPKGSPDEVEISNGEWLESILSQISRLESIGSVTCGSDFNAVLREYQQRGLAWLYTMKTHGLGACLADDMGLGKTLQVIALLNNVRMTKEERTLLVVPATLIGNWTAEIERFAPRLKYTVIHPQENKDLSEEQVLENGVFITTYGMLIRLEWLRKIEWDMLILDEAQAIKNPGTKQTKVVKQIKARHRIAMTGTPMENRLADLWSIFDFLNKGLLGSAKEFAEFSKKLKESNEGYARLKQVVSPFLLRRLKTDKSIIADLPEKIEMKTYAALSKKQAALYGSVVDKLGSNLESSEGIKRKGLVLSALMKLKQICNHPDQYLGQEAYAENESGKFDRLREICETIYEKRERVLIFTQFKEITPYLAAYLESVFLHQGLVLHGETPVAKRKEIVAKFQGREYVPFMVLSIKAGGVGLNLTAANHVIHFDRWWNPATENQATDRAFRIGQQKNVIVHKFITEGTVEEKIDRMIEEKTKMTQEIIPDINESWIHEMDNRQLMDLLKLAI